MLFELLGIKEKHGDIAFLWILIKIAIIIENKNPFFYFSTKSYN